MKRLFLRNFVQDAKVNMYELLYAPKLRMQICWLFSKSANLVSLLTIELVVNYYTLLLS